MNYTERQSLLLVVEDIERLILGDFQYSDKYVESKKDRRIAIKGEG
jgi:hypothetical protein